MNIHPQTVPKLFRPADSIVMIFAVIFSAILFVCASSSFISPDAEATVTLNANGTVYSYSLHEENTVAFESNGIHLTLRISEGSAWIEDATCPDRLCVSTGKIDRVGQSIICVPAKLTVTVLGSDAQGTDGEVKPDATVR